MDDRTLIICATLCVIGMTVIQLGEAKGPGGHAVHVARSGPLPAFGTSTLGGHATDSRPGARLLLTGK